MGHFDIAFFYEWICVVRVSLDYSRCYWSSREAVSDNKSLNPEAVVWDNVNFSFASHWGCTISENEESALEDQWIGIVVTSWVFPPAPTQLSTVLKLFYLRVVLVTWYCFNACWTRIPREWKCQWSLGPLIAQGEMTYREQLHQAHQLVWVYLRCNRQGKQLTNQLHGQRSRRCFCVWWHTKEFRGSETEWPPTRRSIKSALTTVH